MATGCTNRRPSVSAATCSSSSARGGRGVNVTLPHKHAAADLVNELTPRAQLADAVNTIMRDDGTLSATTPTGSAWSPICAATSGCAGRAAHPAARCRRRGARRDRAAARAAARARSSSRTAPSERADRAGRGVRATRTGSGLRVRRDRHAAAFRPDHQRDLGQPARRGARDSRRRRRRAHHLLRHVLWHGETPFTNWGRVATAPSAGAGLGHAGRAGGGGVRSLAQRAPRDTAPVLEALRARAARSLGA